MEPVVIYTVLGIVIAILFFLYLRERRLTNKAIKILEDKNNQIRLMDHQATKEYNHLSGAFHERMQSFGFSNYTELLSQDSEIAEKIKAIVEAERPGFQEKYLARKKAAEKLAQEEREERRKRYEEQREEREKKAAESKKQKQSSSGMIDSTFISVPVVSDMSFTSISCDGGGASHC